MISLRDDKTATCLEGMMAKRTRGRGDRMFEVSVR